SKFNPAAEQIFGYSKDEVLGNNINMLMPEPDKTSHDGYLQRYLDTHQARVVGIRREVNAQRKNGEIFPISLSVNEIKSGKGSLFVGVVSDISERRKQEATIKHQAHFDSLTNLPNRVLFFDRCKNAIALAKRHQQKMAILFLDLDGFKQVNDTLGHKCGDLLLQQVAERLQSSIREVDTVARFGGDEFAFVLNDIKNAATVSTIAQKIISQLSKSFLLEQHSCQIGGSIGISIYPDNETSLDNLIHQADTAMYSVKKSGKNQFQFYDSQSMSPY
ncbi:MAG: diguanylate cyclase, partial [Mariprofundaceae bacterium]